MLVGGAHRDDFSLKEAGGLHSISRYKEETGRKFEGRLEVEDNQCPTEFFISSDRKAGGEDYGSFQNLALTEKALTQGLEMNCRRCIVHGEFQELSQGERSVVDYVSQLKRLWRLWSDQSF